MTTMTAAAEAQFGSIFLKQGEIDSIIKNAKRPDIVTAVAENAARFKAARLDNEDIVDIAVKATSVEAVQATAKFAGQFKRYLTSRKVAEIAIGATLPSIVKAAPESRGKCDDLIEGSLDEKVQTYKF